MSIRMVREDEASICWIQRCETGVFSRPVRDDVVDLILSETAGARGERKFVQRLNRMACIDG